MTDILQSTIFSKIGLAIIDELETTPKNALNINQIIERSSISSSTAYKIMKILAQWDNIKTIITKMPNGRFVESYYLENKSFHIEFLNSTWAVTVNKKSNTEDKIT